MRRVNALRGSLPHVTQSALVALCAKAREGDLPDITSKAEIRASRDAAAMRSTSYGLVVHELRLTDIEGNDKLVEVSNPAPFDICFSQMPDVCQISPANICKGSL